MEMSKKYPFQNSEIETDEFYPVFRGAQLKKFRTPVTPRENMRLIYSHKPACWIPRYRAEMSRIDLTVNPDNVARGPKGGPDMFGVNWIFDPVSGGAMVKTGNPLFEDANDWKDFIHDPNVDSWDWEGFAQKTLPGVSEEGIRNIVIMNGLFERLISWMDFDNALVALIDEDQQDAVHEILDFMCGIYEKIIFYAKKYLDIDVVTFHDDWGSQRATLFSVDTCREMLFPYIKRLAGFAHQNNVFFEHHCCGSVAPFLPLMIEAGVDSWEGQENANDKAALIKQYGDQLLIYICPPDVSEVPEDELEKQADQFLDQFGASPRMLFGMNAGNQRLDEYLYVKTRKALQL